jgi:hypothetical protein
LGFRRVLKTRQDEYKLLEQSILDEGVRDKIVTWQGYIIDGHNRYKIAKKHGLTFETIEKEFDTIEDVKDWMDTSSGAETSPRTNSKYLSGGGITGKRKYKDQIINTSRQKVKRVKLILFKQPTA